jgi:hypothetical protein
MSNKKKNKEHILFKFGEATVKTLVSFCAFHKKYCGDKNKMREVNYIFLFSYFQILFYQ